MHWLLEGNLQRGFLTILGLTEKYWLDASYAATGSLNTNHADKTRKMLEAIDSCKHIWILSGEILPSAKDLANEYHKLFKEILGALPL